MRFFLIMYIAFIGLCPIAHAAPTLENLYINPAGKRLPEAIIFYNTANTCEHCPNTIDKLITVLKSNYQGKLHAYLINIEQHPEFIHAFNLSGPLTLVVIRISDGATFGYRKLSGLQSLNPNTKDFARRITQFINNFLDFKPKIRN